MYNTLSTLAAALALSSFAAADIDSPCVYENVECAPVHAVAVRGSNQGCCEGPGLGGLLAEVKSQLPDSTNCGIVYPDVDGTGQYPDSEGAGITNLKHHLSVYASSCPNSRFILVGYSQGAQVTLDTLCGSAENPHSGSAPLDPAIAQKVDVTVVFGDPSFNVAEPFRRGTATTSTSLGGFIRPNSNWQTCRSNHLGRLLSYCDAGDPVCAGGNNETVHTSYFGHYTQQAADFIVAKVKDAPS